MWGTSTPDAAINEELAKLAAASFIVYDERFYDVMGRHPKIELLFDLPGVHEAPVFLPKQNKVFMSGFNETQDYLIDLNDEPPTILNFTANPPLESVNGGFLYGDTLILGTDGYGNSTPPGLYMLNPDTLESGVLLNNYRGLRLNTPDDLAIDHLGQVWFGDAP